MHSFILLFFVTCSFTHTHTKKFVAVQHVSAWSVIFKPLSYLIFIQHLYCKIVCEQCKWERGAGRVGGGRAKRSRVSRERERNKPSVADTRHRKMKWAMFFFVHLNGVWISYANSFVTLQILMYLNKSNIQIPKICRHLLLQSLMAPHVSSGELDPICNTLCKECGGFSSLPASNPDVTL